MSDSAKGRPGWSQPVYNVRPGPSTGHQGYVIKQKPEMQGPLWSEDPVNRGREEKNTAETGSLGHIDRQARVWTHLQSQTQLPVVLVTNLRKRVRSSTPLSHWNPGALTAVSPVCSEASRRRLRDPRRAAAPPLRARSGPRRCELEEAAVPAPHPGPARPGVETGSRCL
ncbi:hypothetical protein R6Z07F_017956 [Ovis aries]